MEPGVPMGHEQMLEAVLCQPPVSGTELSLDALRVAGIIHEQVIRHEGKRPVAPSCHAVGDSGRSHARQQERRFVRADGADLDDAYTSGQLVPRIEWASLQRGREVVQPGAVAPDGTTERG